jgi:hypothetical protein
MKRDVKLSIRLVVGWLFILCFTVYYLGPVPEKAVVEADLIPEPVYNTNKNQPIINIPEDNKSNSNLNPDVPKLTKDISEPKAALGPTSKPKIDQKNKSWSYETTGYCPKNAIALARDRDHTRDNLAFWESMSKDEISSHQKEWRSFIDTIKPRESSGTKGIIYTSYPSSLKSTLISISLLRKYGCKLPVEIWYYDHEFSSSQVQKIEQLQNVKTRNLIDYINPEHLLSKEHVNDKMLEIKGGAMLFTKFDQFIYLDSDNLPLKDPSFLFETKAFKSTGALFWKDFWKTDANNPIWKIMGIQCENEYEQESGQLVVDKSRYDTWKALNLAAYMQTKHDLYFRLVAGDKDTFRFAWRALKVPYHMVTTHVSAVGTIRGSFCGHTMAQSSPIDPTSTKRADLLFMHINLLKYTSYPRGQVF